MVGALGVMLIMLSLLVMVGWLSQIEILIRIVPAFVPMQFNTAFTFMLSGCGLLALSRTGGVATRVMGILVMTIGGLTMSQHIFDVNLGIDQLLFRPYVNSGVYSPGRMAPTTALCFTLGGSGLVLLTIPALAALRRVIALSFISAVLVSLGGMTLIGYGLGLPETYGWGNLSRMAVHTAAGMVLFGAALGLWTFSQHLANSTSVRDIRQALITYTVIGTMMVAFIATMVGAVPLYSRIQINERKHLLDLTTLRSHRLARSLDSARTVCAQISSRTFAQQVLSAYNHGETTLAQAAEQLTPVLTDALLASGDGVGMVRLSSSGETLVRVGLTLPPPSRSFVGHHPEIEDLTYLDGVHYLVLFSPVHDAAGIQIGLDRILMRPTGLAAALAVDLLGISKTAIGASASRDDDEAAASTCVELCLPSAMGHRLYAATTATVGPPALELLRTDSDAIRGPAIKAAEHGGRGVLGHGLSTSDPLLIAYANLPGSTWSVLVRIPAGLVYGDANQQMLLMGGCTLVLILAGAFGTYLLVRPLSTSMVMHTDELAAEVRMRTATLDVALAKSDQINNALRVSEERFRRLADASPVGIYQTDAAGRCEYTNPRWQQLTGLDSARALGLGWIDAIHPDDRAAVFARWSASVTERQDFFSEFRYQAPSGEVRWVHSRAAGVLDADGSVQGYVGTVEDITERKAMVDSLGESEQRFRSVVESSSAAIILADQRGLIVGWNRGAEVTFGFTPTEAHGQPLSMLMPESFRAQHHTGFARVAGGGPSHLAGKTVELVGQRKDGSHFPLTLSLSQWQGAGGWYFSGIIHDISERKRAENELRAARDAAELATRAKSDFLATMSHEIRTPMNGVIGMAGLLLNTTLTPQQRGMVDTVHTCSDALLTLINDILDFSKIDAGMLALEVLDFDLRQVIDDAVALLAEKAQAKGLELVCAVAPAVPVMVRSDPGRLRQVLVNLIGNAVKFTDRGEVVVRIGLGAPTEPGAPQTSSVPGHVQVGAERQHVQPSLVLTCEIHDTGIGMTDAEQERLFQAFVQADSSTTRRFGGTGLGLAISKRLVTLMGGSITVQSRPGQGSTFVFTLQVQPLTWNNGDRPNQLAGVRILVVDDNRTNGQLLAQQLAAWDMRCEVVEDGPAALRALRSARGDHDPFRVALVDMQMPDMDGMGLSGAIAKDPDLAGIPLVLLNSLGQHREPGATDGIAAFLAKPVRETKLHEVLNRVLDGGSVSGPQPAIAIHTRFIGRILVAEDNLVNQRVTTAQLATFGLQAQVAGNGIEALEALTRLPYDLVLMDCQMPELDGFGATREWRHREQARGDGTHITVVALTANALEGDRHKCLEAGMDDYLSKPVRMDALLAILKRWLPEAPAMTPTSPASSVSDGTPNTPRVQPNDALTIRELVDLYLTETPRQIDALSAAVVSGDLAAIAAIAHRLHDDSKSVGAAQIITWCRQLELAATNREVGECAHIISRLRVEVATASAALRAWNAG